MVPPPSGFCFCGTSCSSRRRFPFHAVPRAKIAVYFPLGIDAKNCEKKNGDHGEDNTGAGCPSEYSRPGGFTRRREVQATFCKRGGRRDVLDAERLHPG